MPDYDSYVQVRNFRDIISPSQGVPSNVYTTEDGVTPYTAEDGVTPYTPES